MMIDMIMKMDMIMMIDMVMMTDHDASKIIVMSWPVSKVIQKKLTIDKFRKNVNRDQPWAMTKIDNDEDHENEKSHSENIPNEDTQMFH